LTLLRLDVLAQDQVVEGKPLNPESMGFALPTTKLKAWFPDNDVFWKNEGMQIAYRNLAVSMPNLLLGFAIWLMWSVLVVRIQQVHDKNPDYYRFVEAPDWNDKAYSANLYNLPAIAGLAGGTFRIPNSFMIMPLGGRLVVSMTTLLLAIPCLIAYAELSKDQCSYNMLIVAAFFSGVGGGAFASSMVCRERKGETERECACALRLRLLHGVSRKRESARAAPWPPPWCVKATPSRNGSASARKHTLANSVLRFFHRLCCRFSDTNSAAPRAEQHLLLLPEDTARSRAGSQRRNRQPRRLSLPGVLPAGDDVRGVRGDQSHRRDARV
jgi:hypothetical protein